MEEAIFADTISELDDPVRRQLQERCNTPPEDEVVVMYEYMMEQIIRIPRLVHYVRRCVVRPNDMVLAVEVVALTEIIYDAQSQHRFEKNIHDWTRIDMAAAVPALSPLGMSFHFPSVKIFTTVLFYFMYRCIICGIIHRLFDIRSVAALLSSFKRSEIEAEEIQAAEHILMCSDFALKEGPDPPLRAIRLYDPITTAWGVWNRLGKADMSGDVAELSPNAARAPGLKRFCKDCGVRIMDLWHAGSDLVDIMEAQSEAFTGGPPLPWMSRRGKVPEGR